MDVQLSILPRIQFGTGFCGVTMFLNQKNYQTMKHVQARIAIVVILSISAILATASMWAIYGM